MNFVEKPAIQRWTRPNFIGRNFGQRKMEVLTIDQAVLANPQISLDVGPVELTWKENGWGDELGHTDTTRATDQQLQMENSRLRIETEVLLHMLTVSELQKDELRNQLNQMKEEIAALIQRFENEDST